AEIGLPADPRRSPADRRQHRQAAGAAAQAEVKRATMHYFPDPDEQAMSMVEKVARAIAEQKVQSLDWRDHIKTARAPIEAVRAHVRSAVVDDSEGKHDGQKGLRN